MLTETTASKLREMRLILILHKTVRFYEEGTA